MDSKEEMPIKLFCMACLCYGRSLKELKNERIRKYYLDTLKEIPLCNTLPSMPVVCWECEALLRKSVTFREQCKDSYRILQTYTNENLKEYLLTEVTHQPLLTIIKCEQISIDDDHGRECENTVFVYGNVKREDNNHIVFREKDDAKTSFIFVDDEDKVDVLSCDYVAEKGEKRNSTEEEQQEETYLKVKKETHELTDNDEDETKTSNYGDADVDDKVDVFTSDYVGEEKESVKRVEKCLRVKRKTEHLIHGYEGDDAGRTTKPSNLVEIEVAFDSLINVKKRKKKLTSVKAKVNSRKVKSKKEYKHAETSSSKILTIDMTYEEMLRERQREKEREGYTKSEYKCDSCLLGFRLEAAYRAHCSRRHRQDLGEYSCPICKTVLASIESFGAHYKRHTRRYECSICHKRTLDLKVMKQHYYTTHEIALKEYKCNTCGKLSKSIDAHRYHRDSHKARLQCPDCEKTFRHRAGLMNHRVSVHELQNVFPCNICDKVFRWKTSLKRHLEKHDIKSASCKASAAFCSLCNVTFASICSYQRHMKNSLKHVSQDQLKYICDHCHRRFADKTKLRDHIEEKHLYKTYQCHICLKPSKNRVGLDQHIRNVHKGRPNNKMCHYCGKGFPTTVQLESHIRTHTGERPYICEFCPTTFSQQSNLYKHNRQVHLNIKSKRFPLSKRRKEDVAKKGDPQDATVVGETAPMAVWRYSPQRGIVM